MLQKPLALLQSLSNASVGVAFAATDTDDVKGYHEISVAAVFSLRFRFVCVSECELLIFALVVAVAVAVTLPLALLLLLSLSLPSS